MLPSVILNKGFTQDIGLKRIAQYSLNQMPHYLLEASIRSLINTHDLYAEEALKTSRLLNPNTLVCAA